MPFKNYIFIHLLFRTNIGKYATNSAIHANAFLSYQNNETGVVGIGWVGSVCSDQLQYRTTISEWYESDVQTGQVTMQFRTFFCFPF